MRRQCPECNSTDEETSDWEPEEVAPGIVEVPPKPEVEVQSEREETDLLVLLIMMSVTTSKSTSGRKVAKHHRA